MPVPRRRVKDQLSPSRFLRRVPRGRLRAPSWSFARSSGRSCRSKRVTETERSSWVCSRPSPCGPSLSPGPGPSPSPKALPVLLPRGRRLGRRGGVAALCLVTYRPSLCPSPFFLSLPLPCPRPAMEGAPRGGEGQVQGGIDEAPRQWPRGYARLGFRLGSGPAFSAQHCRRVRAGPFTTPGHGHAATHARRAIRRAHRATHRTTSAAR